MLAPVRTEAPQETPVSLDEVKLHCRVDFDDDDVLLEAFIGAATAHLEKVLDIAVITQSWRQDFGSFSCLRLPKDPVQEDGLIVEYRDTENRPQTLPGSSYRLLVDSLGPYVAVEPGQNWPAVYNRLDAVSVSFIAGTAVDEVPPALKAAILLHVGHLYQNREAVTVDAASNFLPLGYETLLWLFKKPGV
ncbi:head-tail connector protein [Mesorhizobium sp. M0715]|uniref:head-tail connector protein n=1 Tax=Mesorhizobium sp. M0715 TaxID=2956990 RepID=UPI00333C909D